jgi:REP element-mobilizing transposase RayT
MSAQGIALGTYRPLTQSPNGAKLLNMPQSLAKVVVHLVYSTKHRTPWLADPALRAELYAYMATILKNIDSPAILVGGVADHVHVLSLLSRKFAIKDVVEEAKTETSKWLKKRAQNLAEFHWQSGYGIFSVSESNVEQVKHYIAHQEQHHQRMSFQEEFRKLCERHGVAIDERYVWD